MKSALSSNRIRSTPVLKHVSDDSLVAQARLGSEEAFTELWNRHGQGVRNAAWRITRNREDAEDVLQEAYLKSFLHLVRFNGDSQFSTWLGRIAINGALMLLRKRRKHPEVFIESSESDSFALGIDFSDRSESVESRHIRLECMERLRMAIEQLPPSLRYVVELQNRDELSLGEIAHRTRSSIAAVKSRLLRARATLRKLTAKGPVAKSAPGRKGHALNLAAHLARESGQSRPSKQQGYGTSRAHDPHADTVRP